MKKVTKAMFEKQQRRALRKKEKRELELWKLACIIREGNRCALCRKELLESKSRHVHHILPNTKKYESMRTDNLNSVLLCPFCHRFSPNSPHHNSLYFACWLMENRPDQFHYLKESMREINDIL